MISKRNFSQNFAYISINDQRAVRAADGGRAAPRYRVPMISATALTHLGARTPAFDKGCVEVKGIYLGSLMSLMIV